jgi:hypothetical protein
MKIVNALIFLAAFILVTGGIMFFNSIYANIFKFDFSPITKDSVYIASTVSPKDPGAELKNQLDKKAEPVEKDTVKQVSKIDTAFTPAPELSAKPQVIPVKNQTTETNTSQAPKADITFSKNSNKVNVDTIYQKWVKQTAKLYESMDPQKAARIIKTYSESTARDIIYKMKKKQAADILSELDPATANKITEYPPPLTKNF